MKSNGILTKNLIEMKNILYYTTIDNKNYDLPKNLPIPRKRDLIFLNGKELKEEIVCEVNYVSYHLNYEGKLITICVNSTVL
tara:strand:+ start:4090 stop:4335 length:246 start_codon:yes stop_codon:yes gene_type:complete